jgi:hypothetical protein
MAITNGCGDQNKIHILDKYYLYPVIHAVLLHGRSITCCCGQPIVGEFYQFDAIDQGGNVLNVLFASATCARTLLRLSQIHGPQPIVLLPLFSPLQYRADDMRGELEAEENRLSKHPLNAEIEEAIYLTLTCGDASPLQRRVFAQTLNRIRLNPTWPIMDWEVKSINSTISKGGKCLPAMLDDQRRENPDLKHYTFPEISAVLKREAARTGLRIHCNL